MAIIHEWKRCPDGMRHVCERSLRSVAGRDNRWSVRIAHTRIFRSSAFIAHSSAVSCSSIASVMITDEIIGFTRTIETGSVILGGYVHNAQPEAHLLT